MIIDPTLLDDIYDELDERGVDRSKAAFVEMITRTEMIDVDGDGTKEVWTGVMYVVRERSGKPVARIRDFELGDDSMRSGAKANRKRGRKRRRKAKKG